MDKVYFLKDFARVGKKTQKVLTGFYRKDSPVLIKLHFGEPGNKTAFQIKDIRPIIDALKSLSLSPTMIDSPCIYQSPRHTLAGYKKAVKEKGFTKLAPCIISNTSIKVKTKDFQAGVIKELAEASGVLVLSHVKGHPCSGFGGALKNLGMGGVDMTTKNLEHDLCKPKVIEGCTGCGTCVNFCPAGAITIVGNKATFNYEECYGCSICEAKCPKKLLRPAKAMFDDLLAQGAAAVISRLPKKTYYINVIKNVTKACDCASDSGAIIARDIGVLFSENPVAIDQASVDLVSQAEGRDVFKEESHKDPLIHINFAAKYTGKSSEYELIEI
jgi:hypothetical protein